MTKIMTEMVANTYESPICDIVEIKSEGVLCNSFEEVNVYRNDDGTEELYGW